MTQPVARRNGAPLDKVATMLVIVVRPPAIARIGRDWAAARDSRTGEPVFRRLSIRFAPCGCRRPVQLTSRFGGGS
jgi:hypothetical protein